MEAVRRGLPCRVTAFIEEALRWLPDSEVRIGEAPACVAEPADAPRLRGARVLLAEDNADMRAYVHRLLGTYYAVDTVADGEAALEAIRQRRPDLLLTDVMMPRLDGFGLLRAIRDDPNLRDLPVVMLSARAGEEARVEGLAAGADDYFVKPFAARELLARVESNLKLARVRQEATAELQASECRFRTIVNQADHRRGAG